MSEEELFDDPSCLAGLERDSTPPLQEDRSFLYHYRFDSNQDTKIDVGDNCFFSHDLDEVIEIAKLDSDAGIAALKRGVKRPAPPERLSLIKNEYVDAGEIAQSIYRSAEAYNRGVALPSALDDFIQRRRPRVVDSEKGPLLANGDLTTATIDIVSRMQNTTLCIQGPPGSGKTYTAARAILHLYQQGKTIGITSNSHKAIAHLMDKVGEEAAKEEIDLRAVKLQNDIDDFHVNCNLIQPMKPKAFFNASANLKLIGGTAWVFSNQQADGLLDYLFVDEAGQVSIANLVGMAPSTRNIVLIGDQMQLSQPIQGIHPGESGKSVLDYLLQDKQVIPDDFGIFLGTSWRMHPAVCSFVSGAVYEDRLSARPETSRRIIQLPAVPLNYISRTSGILFIPVDHVGNSQDSEEEAKTIIGVVKELQECLLVDNNSHKPLVLSDILIVAPYNMQVRRLRAALPDALIGSVDKFQGQEAAVVIVSMCSSSGDASPRGLEFIFSKNRLNVAISRARILAIVVGSPMLARTHCNRVEQMELVNLFCRVVVEGSDPKAR